MNPAYFNWQLKSFAQLTTLELFDVMALRQAVFVVEQDCAYQDADALDKTAWHLMGWDKQGQLKGYLRILPPGSCYPEAAIGRVLTAQSVRGKGVGQVLMQQGIEQVHRLYPNAGLCISAQSYLIDFYQNLGFVVDSEPYEEDGIPHIKMRLKQA